MHQRIVKQRKKGPEASPLHLARKTLGSAQHFFEDPGQIL